MLYLPQSGPIAEKEKILHVNTGFLINLYKRSDFFINYQTKFKATFTNQNNYSYYI